MYVDSPHIRQWIEEKRAVLVDAKFCDQFHDYLLTLPWLPTRVDWRGLAYTTIDYMAVTDEEFVRIAESHPIGKHSHVLIFYAPGQPGLLCDSQAALADIDLLYWKTTSNVRYFCGADTVNGEVALAPKDFAEYDGLQTIRFNLGQGVS